MISRAEIEEAILDLKSKETSFNNCAKLADLLIVHDHLYGESGPNERGRNADMYEISGDTDFLKAVKNAGVERSLEVIDELMTVLKISHTRLYESVMRKLGE